jgi:hypothetical protein
MFTVRIIQDAYIQNGCLLIGKSGGTYNHHSALNGEIYKLENCISLMPNFPTY